jgi:uncharacterized delta-60 repeat protein
MNSLVLCKAIRTIVFSLGILANTAFAHDVTALPDLSYEEMKAMYKSGRIPVLDDIRFEEVYDCQKFSEQTPDYPGGFKRYPKGLVFFSHPDSTLRNEGNLPPYFGYSEKVNFILDEKGLKSARPVLSAKVRADFHITNEGYLVAVEEVCNGICLNLKSATVCSPTGVSQKSEYHQGSLDLSFGENGIKLAEWQFGLWKSIAEMRTQVDNKLLIFGSTVDTRNEKDRDVGLTRLDEDGEIDRSFGHNGQIVFEREGSESAGAFVVMDDGSILILATQSRDEGKKIKFWLSKLNSDGHLDTSFGKEGNVEFEWSGFRPYPGPSYLSVDDQGGIVVAKELHFGRLLANGKWDKRFDRDGQVRIDGDDEPKYRPWAQSDGSVLLISQYGKTDVRVQKILPNGRIDQNFGDGGTKILINFSADPRFSSAKVLDDGNILLVGLFYQYSNYKDFFVAKLDPNGDPVLSFGDNGFILPEKRRTGSSISTPVKPNLALDQNGNVFVTRAWPDNKGFAISKISPDGKFDPTFGNNGSIATLFKGSADALLPMIDSEGHLRVWGYLDGKLVVVRYLD